MFRRLCVNAIAIVLVMVLLVDGAYPRTQVNKLTDKEKREAVAFARKFWDGLIRAKDIKPVLKQFATNRFYKCLDGGSFAFVRDDQVREARLSLIKQY
ncbi:hypothetical protein BH20ACI2_BH20ACI2_21690 [soil metagenome]